MLSRVPLSIRVGVGLFLAGAAIIGAWAWWASDAMWMPSNVPITSAGHVTAAIAIPVDSAYLVRVFVDCGSDRPDDPCLGFWGVGADEYLPRGKWAVSRGNSVIASGFRSDIDREFGDSAAVWRSLGDFRAVRGRHVFHVDLAGDLTRFRKGSVRLQVIESGGWRTEANRQAANAFGWALPLVVSGIYLIVRGIRIRRRERVAEWAQAYALTQTGPQPRNLQVAAEPMVLAGTGALEEEPGRAWIGITLVVAGCCASAYVPPRYGEWESVLPLSWIAAIGGGVALLVMAGAGRWRKPSAMDMPEPAVAGIGPLTLRMPLKRRRVERGPLYGMLPLWTMSIITVLLVLICVFLLIRPLGPMGLPVRLLRPGANVERAPGMDPVLVQVTIDETGRRSTVWVNGRAASRKELAGVIRREIVRMPPDWPVYVEGDPAMEFGHVAQVIDCIQGIPARVTLLTRHQPPAVAGRNPKTGRPRRAVSGKVVE